ncbi:hypothetical protein V499_08515 [Pseudogymnoascus sp. VKM F-103]|nr:hypothetical protein V499_08515 [Pseudogymnoascus sp. VKM F-103]
MASEMAAGLRPTARPARRPHRRPLGDHIGGHAGHRGQVQDQAEREAEENSTKCGSLTNSNSAILILQQWDDPNSADDGTAFSTELSSRVYRRSSTLVSRPFRAGMSPPPTSIPLALHVEVTISLHRKTNSIKVSSCFTA